MRPVSCATPVLLLHSLFQVNISDLLAAKVMAGRGGRGAMLAALLAQQQNPGAEICSGADEGQVRKRNISMEQRRVG